MKHTKGPWKCNPLDRAHNFKILPKEYETPVSTDEALANARLIAAAPDLYVQLKVAQKWIEFAKEHCGLSTKAGGDWHIDQDNIRKALAKAEGKGE